MAFKSTIMKRAFLTNYFGWIAFLLGFLSLYQVLIQETNNELYPIAAFFNLLIGLLSFFLYYFHLEGKAEE